MLPVLPVVCPHSHQWLRKAAQEGMVASLLAFPSPTLLRPHGSAQAASGLGCAHGQPWMGSPAACCTVGQKSEVAGQEGEMPALEEAGICLVADVLPIFCPLR